MVPPSWRKLPAVMSPLFYLFVSGAWVFYMAETLAPYSSLLKKCLIHKGIEAEAESMKVLNLSVPKIEAI